MARQREAILSWSVPNPGCSSNADSMAPAQGASDGYSTAFGWDWRFSSLGDPANANRYAYAGDDPVNFVDPSGYNKASDFLTKRVPKFFKGDCFNSAAGVAASLGGAGLSAFTFGAAALSGNLPLAAASGVGYGYAIVTADEYARRAEVACN